MKVIVLRGISGSGKSTWAKEHYPGAVIVSADDYFLQPDGEYDFRPEELNDAHEECYQKFIKAVLRKEPLIVVDNSNRTVWEISPYVMPAQSFGYDVEIITLKCDPEVAIARKSWVAPEKVRVSAVELEAETKKMPSFMKKIHRTIKND